MSWVDIIPYACAVVVIFSAGACVGQAWRVRDDCLFNGDPQWGKPSPKKPDDATQ